MEVYSIGFTRKTAEQFFGLLKRHGVKRLVDVRLANSSQLAGFAKQDDLAFFLKEICGAEYIHMPELAPDKDLLDAWKGKAVDWDGYTKRYLELLNQRSIERLFSPQFFELPTVFLCSEPTAEKCHRRLLLERLGEIFKIKIKHLQ